MDISQYLVSGIPSTAYYIPDFITPEEEKLTLNQIGKTSRVKWTQLSNRRLQNWGGMPHAKGMIPEDIPTWLLSHVNKVNSLPGVYPDDKKANHVLLNEYTAGQGILPHVDGALFYPTITTVSLGSHALLDFYRPLDDSGGGQGINDDLESRHVFSILVEPRSLLILKDDLYNHYLHGIKEVESDTLSDKVVNLQSRDKPQEMARTTRVSLTIRHVPNTKKLRLRL